MIPDKQFFLSAFYYTWYLQKLILRLKVSVESLTLSAAPTSVGAYITDAYWFTLSTSFANPAVTLARTLTNTFAGIRPIDPLGFIVRQVLGILAALMVFKWF